VRFRNLIEALEAAPEKRPFVTAWLDEDERETVTFGEFRRRAHAHAADLHQQGLVGGDRVVVIMPQGIAAMTSFVGAMMLGAIPALLAYPNFKIEPSKYRSGLAGVTANLDAKAVIIDDEFPADMLGHVSLGEEAKLVHARNIQAEELGKSAFPVPEISGDSLAFIQHSAGTTGLQKGVALTHAAVLRQLGQLSQALKIDENADRIYNWLPLYHDMGLIACFMLPMV
jgi:acyl-CoA synthetase (AMP-forming)/AMP-acid ligase II